MNQEKLEDSYEQYREVGFILQKSAKFKKHAFREGAYIDRENEAYEPKATGYVGIIPPNIIVVDNDKYEDKGKSFKKLLKDLNITDELIPFAFTPSGGEHYAFYNPDPDLVVGNLGKKYPALDIYAGYQSVLPIVGTTVYNKEGNLASYEWGDDITESFIINPTPDNIQEVLSMRKRIDASSIQYDEEDAEIFEAFNSVEISDDEIDEILAKLPSDLHYDDWLAVAMSLYDRYGGMDAGLKKLQEFGERSPEKNDPQWTESKWRNGHFKPTQTTYKRLYSISNEVDIDNFKLEIEEASPKDLDKLAKKVSEIPSLNTRTKKDDVNRLELAEAINLRQKTLKKEGKISSVTQARTIVKTLQHEKTMDDIIKEGKDSNVEVFLTGNSYNVRIGDMLIEEISESSVKKHLSAYSITKEVAEVYIREAKMISEIVKTTDYMLEKPISYIIEDSQAIERLPLLAVVKDPFHNITDYINDEEIINDFFNNIWNGKAKDILELIALTVKFKEWKLNRLMIVAPSDTGKTTLTEHLGFQKIHMKRLLASMRGDKGIGGNVINGLKNSGLLLIDEANNVLEQDIKDMDREIYLDEFGAKGGTQRIRLHFTALTSTHKTATRNSSDELYNRFLQVELTSEEMEYPITKSEVYRRDTDRYSEVVQSYSQYHFKECLKNPEYDKDYLHALQEKYRLPINADLDEFLYTLSDEVIDHIRTSSTPTGDIIERDGTHYIKRKTDLLHLIEDLIGELPNIDAGKYADKMINHFIQAKSKSIKIDGKPTKYYPITLRSFVLNEDDRIIDMFENLDEQ